MSFHMSENLYALKLKTGYNIVQENGQRKTGPPPFWTNPPPPKGCEVFIGKIPRDCFEDELFPVFQTVGVIYEFRLMMDFSTSNRGFAFATYTNREDAERAISLLDGYEIRPGFPIGVLKSLDNCKLHIEGIPPNKSEFEIQKEISKYTPGVVKVTSCLEGSVFIEYESHRAASMARKIMIPQEVRLFDCEVIIDWAETDEQKKQVLFVRNIPLNINESSLWSLFSLQGKLSVKKVRKTKNIAFIHFVSHQDAKTALKNLNGFLLNGHFIEVTWAKPSPNVQEKRDELNPGIQSKLGLNAFNSSLKPKQFLEKRLIQYSPAKVLDQLCEANGWGKALYYVVHTSSADESITYYTAKVFIPNFPHPDKIFELSNFFRTYKEAKDSVAEHVLRNITSLQKFSDPVLFNGVHSVYQPQNLLLNEFTDEFPIRNMFNSHSIWNPVSDNQSLSSDENSIWNVVPDNQTLSTNENQDPFLNLMASAASLAKVQLLSKTKPSPIDQI